MLRKISCKKGGVPVVIAIVVAAVVIVCVLLGLAMGIGFGGGTGDGEGDGNVSEAAPEETEPEIIPVIEEMEYLNVTVSGNDYIYQNSSMTLEELIERLKKDAEDTRVRITDENASKKAYKALVKALKENNISYIEAN